MKIIAPLFRLRAFNVASQGTAKARPPFFEGDLGVERIGFFLRAQELISVSMTFLRALMNAEMSVFSRRSSALFQRS